MQHSACRLYCLYQTGVFIPILFPGYRIAVMKDKRIPNAPLIIWLTSVLVATLGAPAHAQGSSEEELRQQINQEFRDKFNGEAGYAGVVPLPRPDDLDIRDLNYPYYYHPNGCSTSAVTHPHLKPDQEFDRNVSRLSSYINFKNACDRHDICYQTVGADFNACNWRFARDLIKSCTDRFTETNNPLKTFFHWINPLVMPQFPICLQLASVVAVSVETAAIFKLSFVDSQENVLKAMIYTQGVVRDFHEFTLSAANRLAKMQNHTPALETEAQLYLELSRKSEIMLADLGRTVEKQRNHIKHFKERLLKVLRKGKDRRMYITTRSAAVEQSRRID